MLLRQQYFSFTNEELPLGKAGKIWPWVMQNRWMVILEGNPRNALTHPAGFIDEKLRFRACHQNIWLAPKITLLAGERAKTRTQVSWYFYLSSVIFFFIIPQIVDLLCTPGTMINILLLLSHLILINHIKTIILFIHLCHSYVLHTYYVLVIVLGAEDTIRATAFVFYILVGAIDNV